MTAQALLRQANTREKHATLHPITLKHKMLKLASLYLVEKVL